MEALWAQCALRFFCERGGSVSPGEILTGRPSGTQEQGSVALAGYRSDVPPERFVGLKVRHSDLFYRRVRGEGAVNAAYFANSLRTLRLNRNHP